MGRPRGRPGYAPGGLTRPFRGEGALTLSLARSLPPPSPARFRLVPPGVPWSLPYSQLPVAHVVPSPHYALYRYRAHLYLFHRRRLSFSLPSLARTAAGPLLRLYPLPLPSASVPRRLSQTPTALRTSPTLALRFVVTILFY